ncbi:MAG TPA: ABC transporter ATP-binding protein [Fimbriimonadaceae bacterium]|nr:ABC transporter ATP-binding protein [Fimbriimonadaceae bacterium]
MPVADIRGLTVRYGSFTALDNFSAVIPEGCVGLLGPNGAGKTTLIKTLLGFVTPASGSGIVMGLDAFRDGPKLRQRIGFMPEQDCHIPGMTAVGFVAYAGELAGMPSAQALRRAHEVLEYCGLGEARYRNVETYSTGMKQKIKLAQALVHGPRLLLLDEPTNGLDPRGREEMLKLIRSISHGKDVNVLVSSHLLPDIERTCDQILLVYQGRLREQGMIEDLKRLAGLPVDVQLREVSDAFLREVTIRGMTFLGMVGSTTYRLQAPVTLEESAARVFDAARSAEAQIRGFEKAERTLEEAFLEAVHG